MKIKVKEKNKIPLTLKYLEILKPRDTGNLQNDIVYYIKCYKYQTDFYVRETPEKSLIRLL